MRFAFDDFVLDEETFELRRDGAVVAMEPQVFDVLRHLVANHHRVVERTELLDRVWGDHFVSDSALSTRIKQARQAIGDDGRSQRLIRTSHGRGFRFVAPVDRQETGATSTTGATGSPGPDPPGPEPAPTARHPIRRPRPVLVHGREADTAAIVDRLDGRRLVTLVGVGGIGKTHLLHHLGQHLADRYEHGAVAVELAPVRSGEAVTSVLLEAIGGGDRPSADPTEAALSWLGSRRVLLLIDNAEHVATDVAQLCRAILQRCPGVDVVVTSRERLNVMGESVHPIGPLDHRTSVELFIERAYDHGAAVEPDRTDVDELCRRLDGVPLALEIMAARAPLLSVADLVADLERHLAASHVHGDERHRSLEAALRWSLDGLAERERRLLEDLTVFAGSFDLEAAEAVSELDSVTEPLLHLCRCSLVVPNPGGSVSRFRLLEPVRLFASSSGAAVDRAQARHLAHYLDVAERADALVDSTAIDRGLELFATEWSNIGAAFEAAEDAGDVRAMTRLVTATANYAEARLLAEVHRWAERAHLITEKLGAEPDPVLVANLARFLVHRAELDRMGELLSGVDRGHPSPHVTMAFIGWDWYHGRLDEVFGAIDPAIERSDPGGYWELTLIMLRVMASPSIGEHPTHLLDRLEASGLAAGRTGRLFVHIARGVRAQWDGRPEEAVTELDAAVGAAEALGTAGFAQVLDSIRTSSSRRLGDAGRAASAVADSIRRGLGTGGRSIVADNLGAAAAVLLDGGRADVAAQTLAARRAAGYRHPTERESSLRQRIDRALDHEALAAAEQRGRSLGLDAMIPLILAALDAIAVEGNQVGDAAGRTGQDP